MIISIVISRLTHAVGYIEKWTRAQFKALGFKTLTIPQNAAPGSPRVEILVTPDWNKHSTQLLIIIPTGNWSMGQFSGRGMIDGNLREGSMLPMVQKALQDGYEIMILNPGEYIWEPKSGRAVTEEEWEGVSPDGTRRLRKENEILQGERQLVGVTGHLDAVFGKGGILRTALEDHLKINDEGRQIYVFASGYPAGALVDELDKDWDFWSWYLHAMVMAEPPYSRTGLKNASFKRWLLTRARTFITHSVIAKNEFVDGDTRFGTSVYAAGTQHLSDIAIQCWELVLEYFDAAWRDPENCNPEVMFDIDADVDDHIKEIQEGMLFVKKAGDGAVTATLESGWDDITELH